MINFNCACKGIRICNNCEDKKLNLNENMFIKKENENIYDLSQFLEKECFLTNISDNHYATINHFKININNFSECHSNSHIENLKKLITDVAANLEKEINIIDNNIRFEYENMFEGFFIVENYFQDNQISKLIQEINSNDWIESQSGRLKQDYGPKINYKKKKVKIRETFNKNENIASQFPNYINKNIKSNFYKIKIDSDNQSVLNLSDYNIEGVGNLKYISSKGAHIVPHIDDYWIWGNRIIGVNLLSETKITFSIMENHNLFEINIPIKSGDMYIMSSKSRYIWEHSVKKHNINDDRIVITLREFEKLFESQKNNYNIK